LGSNQPLDMSDKHDDHNAANQLNPNHAAAWHPRSYAERPDD